VDIVSTTYPNLTGTTTGGTVAVAGTTAGGPADIKRVGHAVVHLAADVASIISVLKEGHIMKRA
jgi:hypothetical protein